VASSLLSGAGAGSGSGGGGGGSSSGAAAAGAGGGGGGGGGGGAAGLAELLDGLLDFVARQCADVLSIAGAGGRIADGSGEAADGGGGGGGVGPAVGGFDFLGNAIWATAEEALESKLEAIFSTGIPSVFVARYRAAMAFCARVEAELCGPPGEGPARAAWRAHPATRRFMRQWDMQLPIYFQMSVGELAAGFDAACSSSSADGEAAAAAAAGGEGAAGGAAGAPPVLQVEAPSAESGGYCFAATRELAACLAASWSAPHYLPALSSRCLRFSLSSIERYAAWLKRAAVGGSPGVLAATVVDGAKLRAAMLDGAGSLLERARRALASHQLAADDDTMGVVRACLEQALAPIGSTGNAHSAVLRDTIAAQCTPALAAVRGVPSLYRMTNKPPPTSASPYVQKLARCGARSSISSSSSAASAPARPLARQQPAGLSLCCAC